MILDLRKILCKLACLAGKTEEPHVRVLVVLKVPMSRQKKVLRCAGIIGVSENKALMPCGIA